MLRRIMLRRTHRGIGRPPYDKVALVLQGGGALGAYQGGVCEALCEAGIEPDWVAGISIGAINAAIIAGNPPGRRIERLRAFWEQVTAPPGGPLALAWQAFEIPPRGTLWRRLVNGENAARAVFQGAPGFFEPRLPPPFLQPRGSTEATSFYDTSRLRETLLAHVDFDRINAGGMRLSLGAVNVRSGNFVYFDSASDLIRPEHVMASGALPPGFPAIEIDGERYWDGGLVSNTPLQWIVEDRPARDTIAFQVDLWSARGQVPSDLSEVAMRQKEIQFSSRTRFITDQFERRHRLGAALRAVLARMPADFRDTPDGRLVAEAASTTVFRIVHLIYRSRRHETDSKDYEFSRRSMREHWRAGYDDAVRTLRDPAALERPSAERCVGTYDLGRSRTG